MSIANITRHKRSTKYSASFGFRRSNHTGWYQRRNNINKQQSTGWNWDFFCHFWTHFTSTLTSSPPVRPDIIILKNWIELKLEFAIKCDSAGNSMWVCLVWSWWVFVNGAAKNTRTQRGLLLSWGGEWEVIPVIIIETIIIIHFNKVYCEFCCSHSSAELRSCGHCGQCCAVLLVNSSVSGGRGFRMDRKRKRVRQTCTIRTEMCV